MKHPIVSTAWLEENLHNPQLILLDASMRNVVGKKPIEYEHPVYIPNSQRFDLEQVFCDETSSQHNAFPTQEHFTEQAQKLGISTDSIVVIYDNQGIYSSPRAWWIFQAMGFSNALVLDGGLPQWVLEQRTTVPTIVKNETKQGNILGTFQTSCVCDSSYIMAKMGSNQFNIVDARSQVRFLGETDEPRAGVRSGHIPHSVNLPFAEILNEHCFKSPAQLAEIFAKLIKDKDSEIVFTCGSGITACIIMLAAIIAGYQHTSLYDGSWADWGSNSALPIEQGKI